ncbi:hypothetical protein [Beggiatoa leptomitoformis]|nr:hypothetical protein [Beggiatoa leptomitoformis]
MRLSTIEQLARALQVHSLDLLRCLFKRGEFPVKPSTNAQYL